MAPDQGEIWRGRPGIWILPSWSIEVMSDGSILLEVSRYGVQPSILVCHLPDVFNPLVPDFYYD